MIRFSQRPHHNTKHDIPEKRGAEQQCTADDNARCSYAEGECDGTYKRDKTESAAAVAVMTVTHDTKAVR